MPEENTTIAAPAPEAPSPAPAAEPNVEEILNFDPFGPAEGSDKGGQAAPVVTEPSVSGDGSAATPPQPQEPTPKEPTAKNPELDLMKKQLKEANDALEAMRKSATPAQPPSNTEPQDTTPSYNFNIPDELVAKLGSEDPRDVKQGVEALASGTARVVHKQVLQTVVNELVPAILHMAVKQSEARSGASAEMQNIRTDFYGTYKEFDKPELHPIIGMMAVQLAKEMNVQGYSPEFKVALAERVKSTLGMFSQPTLPQTPPAKAPVLTGGSGTRTPPSEATKLQNEIMELL